MGWWCAERAAVGHSTFHVHRAMQSAKGCCFTAEVLSWNAYVLAGGAKREERCVVHLTPLHCCMWMSLLSANNQ